MKTNMVVVFSSRPFPNIRKYRNYHWGLPIILKIRLFRHIEEFFSTTTGIQSGPDTFDESRYIVTFLTILGFMEKLCSFRVDLEGKAVESPTSELLEKALVNNFALSDA